MDYHHEHNLQSKPWSSLLLGGVGVAQEKEEGTMLTRIGKYCGAFLLRKRLKRYNFKLYNQIRWNIYSLCHARLSMMEHRVETHYQYAWLGLWELLLKKQALSSSLTRTRRRYSYMEPRLPWAKENLLNKPSSWPEHPECHFFTLGDGARSLK